MNPAEFRQSPTGHLVPTINGAMAFIPNPLPPANLNLGRLIGRVARATRRLGELSGIGETLPNPYLLITPFMRTEAVASSKIEGTVTTLPELFLFEAGDGTSTRNETKEVNNYTKALKSGLRQLEKLPVSSRLILEMHRILMADVDPGRGAHIIPGEFKRDQNWIGARMIENARYVPPPPSDTAEAMSHLERYIHNENSDLPWLIRLALIHYQFEAIHPFPDGNGRIGRILIPLILCEKQEISQPLLYLSSFFERNYERYIDLMLAISRDGAWEPWIEFFLEAVEISAIEAIRMARVLQDLSADYRKRIQTARSSALLALLVDHLFVVPAVSIPNAASILDISYNAAKNNIEKLVEVGILEERLSRGTKWFFAMGIITAHQVKNDEDGKLGEQLQLV
jgi:Fic family protein